jgi:hypothetical protein
MRDIANLEVQVSGLTSEAVKQRGLAVTWLTIKVDALR